MKKPSKIEKQTKTLEKKLEQLNQLGPEELRKRWQALFGSNPPPRLRSSLMVQAIARRLQEKALGDLKPATQRLLERVAGMRALAARFPLPLKRSSRGPAPCLCANGTAPSIR
jgi:hypothetical protein